MTLSIQEIYNKLELKPPIQYAQEQFSKHAEMSKTEFGEYNQLSLRFVGRQCGLTTLNIISAIHHAMNGKRVAIVGETFRTSMYLQKQASDYIVKLDAHDALKNIQFASKDCPDQLRGQEFAFVFIDKL